MKLFFVLVVVIAFVSMASAVCLPLENPCLSHGPCVADVCQCGVFATGAQCEIRTGCNYYGTDYYDAATSTCVCKPGVPASPTCVTCTDPIQCSFDHGACTISGCQCYAGWGGLSCHIMTPCTEPGWASFDTSTYQCVCKPGYYGQRCDQLPCGPATNICSGNGVCNTIPGPGILIGDTTGKCSCTGGHSGIYCQF